MIAAATCRRPIRRNYRGKSTRCLLPDDCCGERLTAPIDKSALFPEPESVDDAVCCPFHASAGFQAERCGDILDVYERAQAFAKKRVLSAPIVLMGEDVFLDEEKFVIEADKIHIQNDTAGE